MLFHQMARIFEAQNGRGHVSHTEEMIRQPLPGTTHGHEPRAITNPYAFITLLSYCLRW
jgi:hypothetical protein